jgi:hypothetical protein
MSKSGDKPSGAPTAFGGYARVAALAEDTVESDKFTVAPYDESPRRDKPRLRALPVRRYTEVRTRNMERPTNASKARSFDQLQYGRDTFAASSEFLRRVRLAPSVASRLRCLADGKGLAASVTLFVGLPRLSISRSSSPSGREIGAHLRRTRWGIPQSRLAQGVLVVPPTRQEYLRGRSRQAVRTNIRHAESLGLTCRRLTSPSERRRVAEYMVGQRPQSEETADAYRRNLDRPGGEWWMVGVPDQAPRGLAVLSLDSEVAMLWSLVCLDHPAKWLLHTHIVGELGTAGVRHLLTSSRMAPVMDPRDQYFQRLLGYRVAHISLAMGASSRGDRR